MATIIPNRPLLAILAILAADLLLTLNDALVARAQSDVGLWTVFWLRGLIAVPVAVLITLAARARFMPDQVGIVMVRTALLLVSWVCLYSALAVMPVANAVATLYTIPLMIALITAGLDRTRPSRLVLGAVGLGFVGVLLIVQPGQAAMSPAYVLPLIAAFSYSCAMILTGRRLGSENPLTVGLWLNYGFVGLGVFAMLLAGDSPVQTVWQAVEGRQWSYLGMGICVGIATIWVAYAYQNGAATVIATFDYAYLIFAIFWGYLFFGQFPNALALLGMGAITLAGVIVMRAPMAVSGPRTTV